MIFIEKTTTPPESLSKEKIKRVENIIVKMFMNYYVKFFLVNVIFAKLSLYKMGER